jgi:hypothetical protein
MKNAGTAIILMLLDAAIQRAHASEKPWPEVTVCLEGSARFGADLFAESIVSKMFTGIGVVIDWRRGLRDCPDDAIVISLIHDMPDTLLPGALAHAFLYEGKHIRVF